MPTKHNFYIRTTIILFSIVSFVFASCDKNDEEVIIELPENITIPIDENSSFNMTNFISSFDQIFISQNAWLWEMEHDVLDGKVWTSHLNAKVHDLFYNKYHTITHRYNDDGIVISSKLEYNYYNSWSKLTFNYKYDIDGYIYSMETYNWGNLVDVEIFEYDFNNKLTKIRHKRDEKAGLKFYMEEFEYNKYGSILAYTNHAIEMRYDYTYENELMVKELVSIGDNSLVYNYKYDGQNRLIEENYTVIGINKTTSYGYSNMLMTVKYYDDQELISTEEINRDGSDLKLYKYYYEENKLDFCLVSVIGVDGYIKETECRKGTLEKMELNGYSKVTTRDIKDGCFKTAESFYDKNNKLLYSANYYVSYNSTLGRHQRYSMQWLDHNGWPMNEDEIEEKWVIETSNLF